MSEVKLAHVTVSFNYSAPSVEFESGGFKVLLVKRDGSLFPEEPVKPEDGRQPNVLATRLMVTAALLEGALWLRDQTQEREEGVRGVVEAFNDLMRLAPESAVTVALEHGMQVLGKALGVTRGGEEKEAEQSGYPPEFLGKGDLSQFEFRPTSMSFEEHEGNRAVRLTCGGSSVLLISETDADSYAVGAVKEEGPQEDPNGLNLRATFVALRQPLVNYLVLDSLEQSLLEDAAQGWEEMKTTEPDKAHMLLPLLLSGAATLEVRKVVVPEQEAVALMERHRKGELSSTAFIEALTGDRPSDAPLH